MKNESETSTERSDKVPGQGIGPERGDYRSGIEIWTTFIGAYLRYVTLWFSAVGLAFVITSFGLKTILVDYTSFETKVGVAVFLNILSVAGLVLVCVTRRRAHSFADSVARLESRLAQQEELRRYFHTGPGTAVMKVLVDFSVFLVLLFQLAFAVLLVILILGIVEFPVPLSS